MIAFALILPLCVQADAPKPAPQALEPESAWELLAKKYDADGDGKISRAEYTRKDKYFTRLDADGDGFIEKTDLRKLGRPAGYRGEKFDTKVKVVVAKQGERAPDFKLRVLEKKAAPKEGGSSEAPRKAKVPTKPKQEQEQAPKPKTFQLSSMKGKKPVALIFGSYT